ncbi:MAG TPA: beta-lactamase family protein [Chloroflexi bacterium]|jgi:CubicO group peptidase (beta-lactamase class C family)|nr:beta-lactamase family protein [Chloroflexota bacterium]
MRITDSPNEIGLDVRVLERAWRLLEEATAANRPRAAALGIARGGVALAPRYFGRQGFAEDAAPVSAETLFLVASITKPVTATAVMRLVEQGRIRLDDPVAEYVPAFGTQGKERVRVRHLLTHTSGLPDMLPDNVELRRAHAPLSTFIERICQLPLDFAPGTAIQYQSCGIAMLGEIVHRVSGIPLAEFLRREVFGPLGMSDTYLGIPEGSVDPDRGRVAEVRLPPAMEGSDWGWNSPYWHALGAPWGGMISTVADMVRFGQCMLQGGELDGVRLLSRAAVDVMTRDQTGAMTDIPAALRCRQAWGLGWRLVPTHEARYFGDLLSPGSFGHGGATGTVMWVDPVSEMVCCLFTTEPLEESERLLGQCSTVIAAAAVS